jgi:putative oxidoreductase
MEFAMNASHSATVAGSTSLASIKQQPGSVANYAELAGRILMAVPFLLSGLGKLGAYSATAGYMSAVGVPGVLLPAVIATEVLGALAIILGWKTRVVAFLLAGFCLLTALIFHRNFADQMQMINFLKNVSMAGGFLVLAVHGGGRLSIDSRFAR